MLLAEEGAGTDNPKRMLENKGLKLTIESSGADTGAKLILGPVISQQD